MNYINYCLLLEKERVVDWFCASFHHLSLLFLAAPEVRRQANSDVRTARVVFVHARKMIRRVD